MHRRVFLYKHALTDRMFSLLGILGGWVTNNLDKSSESNFWRKKSLLTPIFIHDN